MPTVAPAPSGQAAPSPADEVPGQAAAPTRRATPSIRTRLANALVLWSLAWSLAVGAAAWLAASHEVDELLDDGLQSAGELLAQLVLSTAPEAQAPATEVPALGRPLERFAWQVVAADGRLLQRSARAPAEPWRSTASAGFGDTAEWRLYGLALGNDGRMLYAAQTREERIEARVDVALGAVLSALAVGLLGHAWLRARIGSELTPLQALADRLDRLDIDGAHQRQHDGSAPSTPWTPARLGRAERRELEPVHRAIDGLTQRLAQRIASEQAFSAQAAHALRTPLAGIDAQLAVALQQCPPDTRARLQRVRGAATRLQAVVAALLGLFRSGSDLQPRAVALAPLLARLPPPTLQVHCPEDAQVWADQDLLAAALANLLDNAQRHGARTLWLSLAGADRQRLCLRDDGPGMPDARRRALQDALARQAYDEHTGLGLVLADRVARAHGGALELPAADTGFAVDLYLGPAPAAGSPRPA